MERNELIVAGGIALALGLSFLPACSSSGATATCSNGVRDGDETGVDCGGSCPVQCDVEGTDPNGIRGGGGDAGSPPDAGPPPRSDDNIQNGTETDVDCGGANAPTCADGKKCLVDGDCSIACSYANKCIPVRSCKPHLGGDTCGLGEVGQVTAQHESCCRTLTVDGFEDPRNPGKTVTLDKYEITTGRVRAFLADITARSGGKPDIRGWVAKNTPPIWDADWNKFLPSAVDTDTVRVSGYLLGDVRPGVVDNPPPGSDQNQRVGVDYQFNGELYVYLHGNNCRTHAGSFGFPTFFYPANVLALYGFPPRANGTTLTGEVVPASEHLEVKSMNCITNAMLAAFCHWDGGQLATDDVLDFVTDSPSSLGYNPGCGTQVGWENPPTSYEATKGGRCADLARINATYDAGGQLPLPGHPLNETHYVFPFFAESVDHDNAWMISAPGRGSLAANGEQVDVVRAKEGDEPWVDLAGNLSEAAFEMNGATFSGRFTLKYRGIGYQSARSELNVKKDWPGEGGRNRLSRPEARGGFAGGRCMRFK